MGQICSQQPSEYQSPSESKKLSDDIDKLCEEIKKELNYETNVIYKSKLGVEYKYNDNGSLTFYPTPDVKRGETIFETKLVYDAKEHEAAFDFDKKVIKDGPTSNSFVNCYEVSYGKHYPVSIKPQHIFILIIQAISKHVNANAEALRDKFVNHNSGKVTLKTKRCDWQRGDHKNDWNGIIKEFVEKIDKNSKKDIVPLFTNNFSTSTLNEQIATKITLMTTVKEYFNYMCDFGVSCGFPEITLEGNINDWILLKHKVQQLLDNKVKKKFGKEWSLSLLPILDEFINAFKGKISMVFWNSMIWRGQYAYIGETHSLYYDGSPYYIYYKKFISGWINVFFPYLGSSGYENEWAFKPYKDDINSNVQYKGKQKTNDKDYANEENAKNDTQTTYDDKKTLQNTEEWKNVIHDTLGPQPYEFSESIVFAPVECKFNGKDLYLHFTSGFVGYEQNKETLQLTPTVGWYIQEAEREENKPKSKFDY